jgi:hypothetical protein
MELSFRCRCLQPDVSGSVEVRRPATLARLECAFHLKSWSGTTAYGHYGVGDSDY